jgi:hypothetical protein
MEMSQLCVTSMVMRGQTSGSTKRIVGFLECRRLRGRRSFSLGWWSAADSGGLRWNDGGGLAFVARQREGRRGLFSPAVEHRIQFWAGDGLFLFTFPA